MSVASKNNPFVSVVMPVYNAENIISNPIESILNQTLKDFELIIINDASTDKTLQVIEKFRKKDRRIKVINNEKNMQMAHSLNVGISEAKSEFVARMDQDDIAFKDRLEVQYNFLLRHPRTAIVGNDIITLDKDENVIGRRTYPTTSKQLKSIMFRYSPFAHSTVMFRKNAYERIGGYDRTKYPCEDIDLWFRLGQKYEFASIPRALLNYRVVSTSSSHSNVLGTELMGFRIKIEAFKKYGYKPTLYDVIYNILQFVTMWFMPSIPRMRLYNFLRSRNLI